MCLGVLSSILIEQQKQIGHEHHCEGAILLIIFVTTVKILLINLLVKNLQNCVDSLGYLKGKTCTGTGLRNFMVVLK